MLRAFTSCLCNDRDMPDAMYAHIPSHSHVYTDPPYCVYTEVPSVHRPLLLFCMTLMEAQNPHPSPAHALSTPSVLLLSEFSTSGNHIGLFWRPQWHFSQAAHFVVHRTSPQQWLKVTEDAHWKCEDRNHAGMEGH